MKEISITEHLAREHPLVQMPPLWGVIYYEGIHGNHILFSPHEVLAFEAFTLVEEDHQQGLWLEDAGFALSSHNSYRDMVDYLARLSFGQRQRVYQLYKSWLAHMSQYLKGQAH